MKDLKVALVHDSLTQHGGAEKTVEAMCEIFPNAPIYTSIYKPKAMGNFFKNKDVIAIGNKANKLLSSIPILSKYFTFLLPQYFESLDLSSYDVILSSSSSYAKGVLTKPSQLHVSYIHTPPRFLYGYSVESTKRNAWYYKPVVMIVDHFLRIWDFLAAQRPDYLVTNSINVQNRISKFYKRDSVVIYPPVETSYAEKKYDIDNLEQPYYVALGRLSAYKNFDLIINAFNILGINLKIIGTGTSEQELKKIAKANIKFLGRISDEEKHKTLSNSLGYIFPVVEEDFGITVVEALAHGKPVLAHNSGGPKEILEEGVTGMLFNSLNLEDFMNKIKEFDMKVRNNEFNSDKAKEKAKSFSKEKFQKQLLQFIDEKWEEKNRN